MPSNRTEPTTTRSRTSDRTVALATGVVPSTIAPRAGVASAHPVPDEHAGAATFTKWVTDWPNMAGVAGGSVGDGAFSGKVLDYNPGPTTVIAAIYHFAGSRHDFTALMHVEQTGLDAVISGVVIDGWEKGKFVSGEYTQISCDHDGTATDCFRGSVRIGRGLDD